MLSWLLLREIVKRFGVRLLRMAWIDKLVLVPRQKFITDEAPATRQIALNRLVALLGNLTHENAAPSVLEHTVAVVLGLR